MTSILTFLKIRPEERRISFLLVTLMFLLSAGGAIGGNATEALFFARFGVRLLPVMYILLGVITFGTTMLITVLMGRIPIQRLYAILPFGLGLVLLGERLFILLQFRWFFALMWLVMNVIGTLQSLLLWGLASGACDTRQSKRLFPLFSAGGILGTVAGGLLTPLLAAWLHSENLLLVWSGMLFASYILARGLVRNGPAVRASSPLDRASAIDEMQRGFRYVRGAPILRWISYSAVLFSVCFFSLALPFSRGVTVQYPDADRLAGFLGLFQSIYTTAALLASLFLTNRFFARFGIMPMLMILPVIYLLGFGILNFIAPFALLAGIRLVQMAYMNGVANPSWQAVFNVVPLEQREQVRAFVGGVPEQAGTFIAGFLLLAGEALLKPQQLFLFGSGASILLLFVIWKASKAYRQALVDALREGQPQVFFYEEQPFGGMRYDAAAVEVLLNHLKDPDAKIRQLSTEIIWQFPVQEAQAALVDLLRDEDVSVRTAAIRGLARSKAGFAQPEISLSLSDPVPEVRREAIEALMLLSSSQRAIFAQVEPLLQDEDPFVRIKAAQLLLSTGRYPNARQTIDMLMTDLDPSVRAQAVLALSGCADKQAFQWAEYSLENDQPIVRAAAAKALASIDPRAAIELLIRHLDDSDTGVRKKLGEVIGSLGETVVQPLLKALDKPDFEDGALAALEHLPCDTYASQIRAYVRAATRKALHYHRLVVGISHQNASQEIELTDLLIKSLRSAAYRYGTYAIRGLGLISNKELIASAVQGLSSRDPAQRANAIEMMETAGERETIQPLLVLWEADELPTVDLPDNWLLDLLDTPDRWLRACAVLASRNSTDLKLNEKLALLSETDPDEFVRLEAQRAIKDESYMETLATLSIMERILFLNKVPLFAELPPADLKQIAAITREILLSDGQVITHQGDPGVEMFIIVSGKVEVSMTPDGKKAPETLAFRHSGDYVGEMAIIDQEPRMATLIARGQVRLLGLKQKQLEGILRERPEISLGLIRVLSQRLREASSPGIIKPLKTGQG